MPAGISWIVLVFLIAPPPAANSDQPPPSDAPATTAPQAEADDPQLAELAEVSGALLNAVDQQGIDPATDDLVEMRRKRQAMRRALGDFAQKAWGDEPLYARVAWDYVMYRNAASPRLSGRIVRVGPNSRHADLAAAAMTLLPGDLVLLGTGEYVLPDARSIPANVWTDVAIVGQSPAQTTLRVVRGGSIESANRLLLENLRFDCMNDPVTDMRAAGSIHLRECEIFAYNSGSGGSSALNVNDAVVLIERCSFEGESGRASGRGQGGNALDLRGDCLLYARQCQFIDNREVLRATFPCVFDGCMVLNASPPLANVMVYQNGVIAVRDSPDLIDQPNKATSFVTATDEIPFLKVALGDGAAIDDPSQKMMTGLQMHRRLPYWIGLLRHEMAEIRAIAARQVARLTGLEVSASPPTAQENAVGEPVPLDEGSSSLAAELEYARLMNWFDAVKTKLKWDQKAGRYQSPDQE